MTVEVSRRSLLKGMVGAVAAVGLPRSMARAQSPVAKSDVFSVLVDIPRCIGCRACLRGCQRANISAAVIVPVINAATVFEPGSSRHVVKLLASSGLSVIVPRQSLTTVPASQSIVTVSPE